MFTSQDLAQLQARGSAVAVVEQQIQHFVQGFPFLPLVKAATVGDGILQIDQTTLNRYVALFEAENSKKKIVKFIPASGAASRMFQALFSFRDSYKGTAEDIQKLETDKSLASVKQFFAEIEKFAFYNDLSDSLDEQGMAIQKLMAEKNYVPILDALLTEKGLNYGNLPKGLLQFHLYGDEARTPFEERLVEGANYAQNKNKVVHLHFTVSPEHLPKFEQHLKESKYFYEKYFGVTYHVTFSEQKPSTDTIAVDGQNQPFRNADGSLLFRPAGHGALLENLDDLDADLVFIKNIDNVVPDRIKHTTYDYKKALFGVLLEYQTRIFNYLRAMYSSKANLAEVEKFVQKELCIIFPSEYSKKTITEKSAYLIEKLNRPIRICGMVKNEGEPGGGPFWAKNADGSVSLQIAESAQIDMNDPKQKQIAQSASHFNPVDLLCSLKDWQDKKFYLPKFRDEQTGFISKKSKDGKELKAQELPGLWNGAMSNWITIFLEVPVLTFNPVKTVNDLLREQHQNS
ncbi:MAG: DUF4301 family protein [Bacteroidetes bacterium]|nr:MAG: DUF4301 family protein [Bacteroidota bacterium]